MVALIKNSFKDLKDTYKRHILFGYLFMLITSLIFVPLIAFIYNRILWSLGSGSLINADIYKIVLNYKGVIGLIIIGFISVFVLYVQFGVTIVLAQKQYFKKEVSIFMSFITVVKKTRKIFRLGVLLLSLFFLFLIPFIDSPLLPVFVKEIDINLLIKNKIIDSNVLLVFYILGVFLIIHIILRRIFALHYIIIENQSTKDALKNSKILTKKNKTRILVALFILNILIVLLGLITITVTTFVPIMINREFDNSILENFIVILSSFLTYLLTLLIIPINTICITRLFYKFNNNIGKTPKDNLKIYHSKKLEELNESIKHIFFRRKLFHIGYMLIFFSISFFVYSSVTEDIVYIGRDVSIASHRGDKYSAPENSKSSIYSAIDKNVDFVEIDIQMTKDGVLVLNHDIDLKRVAGVSKKIFESTYEEISYFDIGFNFSQKFAGERIPTLEEILIESKDKVKLLIDIKPYGLKDELVEKTVTLIEEYDMVEDCYVQSFDTGLLKKIRNKNPNIKIGQLLYAATGSLSSIDVDFYSVEKSILSHKLINNAQKLDREVWVWTVDNERTIKQVLKYSIDGIITSYPETVQNIIGLNY
ncbi:MAG: glycerophosphoryl diester phosphodiesterase membrane domain-containing protein [Eubacteriales bacterium]